jgi:glycosyltransferase involved in cell wall biosynthesis
MSSYPVSVVIPCFNQGRFLADALDSVVAQSRRATEIVVIDDGSTDNTPDVAARYPSVRCIRRRNRGLASARNSGIRHTTGEYVVFLDADDRLRPEALEIGVRELTARPGCAFVWGRCIRIDSRRRPLSTVPPPRIIGDAYDALLRNNMIWTPAVAMFRRAVCGTLLRFDAASGASADYDLYLRIARTLPVHDHAATVAEYRLHRGNMSRDVALMLASTLAVLRTQRSYARSRAEYARAYRVGRTAWRAFYGELLLAQLTDPARRPRDWWRMARTIAALARYYPRGLAAGVVRRLRVPNEPVTLKLSGTQVNGSSDASMLSAGGRPPDGISRSVANVRT